MTSLNHHCQIFKCKEIPEYLRNTTCSDHEVFEITTPALISRMWNFTMSVMTQVHDGTLEMTSGIWKKCIMVSRVVIGKVWYGLQYIWIGTVNWTREKFEWFSDLTWNGAKRWLGKLLWNCTEWFAWILWILADFTITATYLFAEMVQNKSAELIQMMIYGVTWIVEPFVPVFSYITDVAVDLYFGFLHGKSTLLRIEFPHHKLAWQQREIISLLTFGWAGFIIAIFFYTGYTMQFIEDDLSSFYFFSCTILFHNYYIRFKEKERLLVFWKLFFVHYPWH